MIMNAFYLLMSFEEFHGCAKLLMDQFQPPVKSAQWATVGFTSFETQTKYNAQL